jgi:hypothetical protein
VLALGDNFHSAVLALGNSYHGTVLISNNRALCALPLAVAIVHRNGHSITSAVHAIGAACDNIARRAPTYGQTEPTYGTHERGIYRRVIARAAVSACRGVATRGQRWVPSC